MTRIVLIGAVALLAVAATVQLARSHQVSSASHAAARARSAEGCSTAPVSTGTIDAGFGSGGVLQTDFGGRFDTAFAVAVQPDCRLLVAGSTGNGSSDATGYDLALARLNADGSRDPGFGSNGVVRTDVPGAHGTSGTDVAYALALQADGKIVSAGVSNQGSDETFVVVRYNADGSLDSGFGNAGIVVTAFPGVSSRARALSVLADGRLLVAGVATQTAPPAPVSTMALAAYQPDGTLDRAFGTNGLATADFGADTTAEAMAVQPNGAIVVVGRIAGPKSADFAVARFTADGRPDASFGTRGLVTTDIAGDDAASAVLLLADGTIVAAGRSTSGGSVRADIVQGGATMRTVMAVARYHPDGAPDLAFGDHGTTTIDFGGSAAAAAALTATSDGGILLAGTATPGGTTGTAGAGSSEQFAFARIGADGAADPRFGTNGRLSIDVGGDGRAQALATQPDGAIVVAGTTYPASGPSQVTLVRYIP